MQAKVQADTLCSKLIDMAPNDTDELDVREIICRDLEQMCGCETVILLRQ